MRITNGMMTNRMMLNINRSGTAVNNLYMQGASGKKIQMPSENPIIASRALKFRTTVAENAQYQKNAVQGQSWMDVTEEGINKATDVLAKIRELMIKGDAAESMEDKQIIANQVKSLAEELAQTVNKSYTGRYLFSGFKTDEPGSVLFDDADMEFHDIMHSYTAEDIEKIKAIQKEKGKEPVITDANILKLPYKNVDNLVVNVTDGGATTPVAATTKSMNDVDAYKPGPNEIFYIEETGEMVLGENIANADEFDVNYDKTGFSKGELNPKVYFDCTEIKRVGADIVSRKDYTMDDQDMEYEYGIGVQIPVNVLGKDVITSELYSDLMSFTDTILNAEVSSLPDVIAILKADPAHTGKTDEELEALANEQIERERQKIDTGMQQKFSNMIGIIDEHNEDVSEVHTDLGTRMTRVELIQKRLEEDEISYKSLMSENEDINVAQVAMDLKNAEAAYQAAMQIGINMLQLSLVNFL